MRTNFLRSRWRPDLGIISKSIFDLGTKPGSDIESDVVVLGDWDSIAVSKWPLSYRGDARNWRLSNQKRF